MSWSILDRWSGVQEWTAQITCLIQESTTVDDAAPGVSSKTLSANYKVGVTLRGDISGWSGEGTATGTWSESIVTQGPGGQLATGNVDGAGSGIVNASLGVWIDMETNEGVYELRAGSLSIDVHVVTVITTAGHTDTVTGFGGRTVDFPDISSEPLPASGLALSGDRLVETDLGPAMLSWVLTPAPPVLTVCYIEIVDHTGAPFTGVQTVNVGKRIRLQARVILPLGGTITSLQWNIPGIIVHNYLATSAAGQVLQILPRHLQATPISFYWVDDGAGRVVEVSAVVDGLNCTARVTFDVNRPSMNFFIATSSPIAVGIPPSGTKDELFFRIDWEAEVTTGASGAGRLAFTQLIDRDRRVTDTSGIHFQTNLMTDYGLDSVVIYSGSVKAIRSSQTVTHKSLDIPGIKLDGFVAASALDAFEVYLMYQPDAPGSIWVPLGRLVWGWCALAHLQPVGTWALDPAHRSNHKVGTATTDFPEWTMVITRGETWPTGSAPAACPPAAQPWE